MWNGSAARHSCWKRTDYWGEKPAINKVTYRFVGEPGTRLAGLMAGEFDVITNLLPEFTEQVPQAIHILGLEHPIIILNADGGLTKDVRVRQALNYAVDKQALAEGLFEGFAQVAQGQLLSPSFFGFNKDVGPYPYDPEKAKALLKEAGAGAPRWSSSARPAAGSRTGNWSRPWPPTGRRRADDQGAHLRVQRIPEPSVRSENPGRRHFRGELQRAAGRGQELFGLLQGRRHRFVQPDASELADLIDRPPERKPTWPNGQLYHQAVKLAYDQAYFVWLLNIEDIYGVSARLGWPGRVDAKTAGQRNETQRIGKQRLMGRYILKRLWHGAIVILGVTVIVFVVTRMVGDPVKVMLPLEATLEQRAAFEKQLGLDRPIPVQFVDFMGTSPAWNSAIPCGSTGRPWRSFLRSCR